MNSVKILRPSGTGAGNGSRRRKVDSGIRRNKIISFLLKDWLTLARLRHTHALVAVTGRRQNTGKVISKVGKLFVVV